MPIYAVIIFLAIAGFFIAFYIASKKRKKEALVCPMKAKCSQVVHSRFSKFLGIPVEYLGIAYYGSLAIGYILSLSGISPGWLSYLLLAATAGGFLFSVYLTFIQIFALREYCSWCLISAAISTALFIIALYGSIETVAPFLAEQRGVIITLHAVGAAIGLGAATIADYFFFKFLKDYRISQEESDTLETISEVIWLALAIIVMTGLGIFLSDMAGYAENPKFLAKMLIVLIIIINGSLLNLFVAPKLVQISFHKKHDHHSGELKRLRNLAFTFGPISIISWYFAFVLGSLRAVPLTFVQILILYGAFVLIGIGFGNLFKGSIMKKATNHNS